MSYFICYQGLDSITATPVTELINLPPNILERPGTIIGISCSLLTTTSFGRSRLYCEPTETIESFGRNSFEIARVDASLCTFAISKFLINTAEVN